MFFILAGSIQAQQTEEEIKEKANRLFDQEQYVEATSLFLRLISLHPEDVSYNYKYGTCLLFNSDDQKKDALRYLSFAIKSNSVDPRAYYFRGRAFHLNYQFKEAKWMYQAYEKKRSPEDIKFDVTHEIEMCDNGKSLLSTFTDIIVSEKKQIDETKFFRLYHDMESIGGKILVTERFQSKMDKKLGHVPIVHFPKDAKAVYYASYGEKGDTGLDIYIRKKLPDGSWGKPFPLPGEVNTPYDDNFPYLHPSGRYLYFSSKGHNSMGGYDVFMSRYDTASNGFVRTENVDFAICSPDDDLFYVVDADFQNAYFASSRQSEQGKVHVYRVKVTRIPIQEVIIMGDFLSEINPKNKDMLVTVLSGATGDEIGQIMSNADGKYSYVFPKGGKYTYRIKIDGIEEVTEIDFDLPFLDEFRPLKQRVIHKQVDGGEVVQIVNLFDELIEGGSELIGSILRKKAELDVNVDDFDPSIITQIELEQRRDEILTGLGFSGMAPREVQNQLVELSTAEQSHQSTAKKMSDGIDQNIVDASLDLKELVAIQQDLINNANLAEDPAQKYEYLTEAKKIGEEITAITDQIGSLIDLKGDIQAKLSDLPANDAGVTELKEEFDALLTTGDEEAAWNLLALNQSKIFAVRNGAPEGLIADMIDEGIELKSAQTRLRETSTTNTAEISRIEADIVLLKGQLPGAKKKQERQLLEEIASKEEELQIFINENRLNRGDMIALDIKSGILDGNIGVLQESVNGNLLASVGSAEVEAAIKDANDISNGSPDIQILNDIAALESQYPEIASTEPLVTPTNESTKGVLETAHADAVGRINDDPTKTEIEKLEGLIANNEQIIGQLTIEVAAIQSRLDDDPENMDLLVEQLELVEYRNELEASTNGFVAEIKAINSTNPPVAVSKQDVINSISPSYTSEILEIKSSPQLTPKDKLIQTGIKIEELNETIATRIGTITTELDTDPGNPDLLGELGVLQSVKSENDVELITIANEIENIENATPTIVQVTEVEVVEGVKPGHGDRVTEIAEDTSLSPGDKLKQFQENDEDLLTRTNGAITKVDQDIEANPGDPILIERKKTLEGIATNTSNVIDERAQEINAIDNVSSIIDVAELKVDMLADLSGTYQADKDEINQSGGSTFDISIGTWDLEQELLDKLKADQTSIEETAGSNPEDSEAQAKLSAINELIDAQIVTVKSIRDNSLLAAKNDSRYADVVDVADKKYRIEMGDLTQETPRDNVKIADREVEFQKDLQTEIDKKKRALQRKYSIEVDLEWMILENELAESKIREEAARNATPIIAAQPGKTDYIEEIRTNLLVGDAEEVEKIYTTKEELETQDQVLGNYENELITEIALLEAAQIETPSPIRKGKIDWLNDELSGVREKRGMISISLGEFSTEVIAVTPSAPTNIQSDPTLNQLEADKNEIIAQLNNPELSGPEQRELNESLETIETAQTVRGNEIGEEKITSAQGEQEDLTNQLLAANDGKVGGSVTIANAIDASTEETKVINQLIADAEDAGSPAEKAYLLNQAETRQTELNETLEEVIETEQISAIEENAGVRIITKNDLEERKRRYTIQIGDFDTQIFQVEEEINEARRKEIPGLEEKRDGLVKQRTLIAGQLTEVNQQLENFPITESLTVIATTGLDQTVSFNEERTIAASEGYAVYREEGVKALELENQLRTFETDIEVERAELVNLIRNGNPALTPEEVDQDIVMRTNRIKQMEVDIDRINSELAVQSVKADQLLPANQEEAMKMQNLLARGVQPIKLATVALSIMQMPSTGLAIGDATTTSVYSTENPIPVGVESPSGLTYRVQVGAFARPIPQDLFKEFNPVSGEKIGTTGVTRYMAGFFNNSVAVVDARQQIRGLGYRDAFVVAYCDGERISFGEAIRREASGTCVPKGTNELMLEVAENTAVHLGLPLTSEVKEVPEYSYNQAPGAAPAEPIELKMGLFYTVQIGAFNRPVSDKKLKNLPEILTIRLANGLIRYSTGMFDSASACKSRKIKAYESGITDAFIVAYYKGERINVAKANRLLAENGPSILQSNIVETEPVVLVEMPNVTRTDTVVTNVIEAPVGEIEETALKVQVVTKQTFPSFPRDILNRYNTEGTFYYDAVDGKVKSIIYDHPNSLPRLYKFEKDIDTIYISPEAMAVELAKKTVSVAIVSEKVPGDLIDLLLRLPYRREFVKEGGGTVLEIQGVEPNALEGVLLNIRSVGLNPTVVENATNEN